MTHAYMILAHNEFPLLTRLLSVLDFPDNSLFVHIDKKVKDDVFAQVKAELEGAVKRASLAFTPRVEVSWGDFSMVQAELVLLREASKSYHDYCHLLSGVDLPLKPHSEITRFFEENAGKEVLQGFCFPPRSAAQTASRIRLRYYYPFQHTVGHNYLRPLGLLQWLLLPLQALVGVNRLRRLPMAAGQPLDIYKGAQWFSVTHDFALDLLEFYSHDENLKPYRHTMCADEIFVQMFAYHSKYKERIYMQKRRNDHLFPNNMRMVWFEKGLHGSPITFTTEELPYLLQSNQLWARKFSFEKHPDVVDAIMERISPQ